MVDGTLLDDTVGIVDGAALEEPDGFDVDREVGFVLNFTVGNDDGDALGIVDVGIQDGKAVDG